MRLPYIYLLLVLSISTTFAQNNPSNVLKFTDGMNSPKASLQEISWISGYWRGEAFGGTTEEIWSDPLGNSMMFSFKLVVDNEIQFYEVGGITENNNTLLLQLKHFHGDFKGWEKKDETIDFKLVKVEKDRVYFDEFTFEKISDNEINLYVVVHNKDGSREEVKFNYKRK